MDLIGTAYSNIKSILSLLVHVSAFSCGTICVYVDPNYLFKLAYVKQYNNNKYQLEDVAYTYCKH